MLNGFLAIALNILVIFVLLCCLIVLPPIISRKIPEKICLAMFSFFGLTTLIWYTVGYDKVFTNDLGREFVLIDGSNRVIASYNGGSYLFTWDQRLRANRILYVDEQDFSVVKDSEILQAGNVILRFRYSLDVQTIPNDIEARVSYDEHFPIPDNLIGRDKEQEDAVKAYVRDALYLFDQRYANQIALLRPTNPGDQERFTAMIREGIGPKLKAAGLMVRKASFTDPRNL